ncbi:uncharacterized protein METZ01_LOCUS277220, partial [marine metagenome]
MMNHTMTASIKDRTFIQKSLMSLG